MGHPERLEGSMPAGMRLVAMSVLLALAPHTASAAQPRICPDRIVLKPRAGIARETLRTRLASLGIGGRAWSAQAADATLLSVPVAAQERTRVLNELAARPDVGFAAPVYLYQAATIPDDPAFVSQYHHTVMGSASAWDVTRGTASVVIAVIDTGVDAAHPDLAGKLLAGYNAVTGGTDTRDDHGHGTAVAGCAAAATNNGKGVAGMSWASPILPIRVVGGGDTAASDTIAAGMRWAVDHGARIVNISFGPLQGDLIVRDAAAYVRSRGGLVFCAMGNDATRRTASEDPNIVFVTATDVADAAASFTNFGPSARLAAPGKDVWTTLKDGGVGSISGTSFSSPLAAGAAALVWAANPALTAGQVEQCLFATAKDLGATGRDELFGHGRVNVAAAVRRATALAVPAPIAPAAIPAVVTSPAPGSTLASSTATFAWSAGAGVTRTWLHVGTAADPVAYFSRDLGSARSGVVAGLPADGSAVRVTLWSLIGGTWQYSLAGYRAHTAPVRVATILSPPPQSTLSGARVTFSWTDVGASAYWFSAGSTAGGTQYASTGTGRVCWYTPSLPADGSVVYVRIWSLIGGSWRYAETVYRAGSASARPS